MTTIAVQLCVNDSNGDPSGTIGRVEIADLISLEGPMDFIDDEVVATTVYAEGRKTITVGARTFPHHGYGTWSGNIHWDAAWLEPQTVLDLLNHLKWMDWDCHEAEEGLFDRWREPGELTMEDLVRAGMEMGVEVR